MKRRIVINGRFLGQPVTGVQRYGREILSALAKIIRSDSDISSRFHFEILVPTGVLSVADFQPIPVKPIGTWTGQPWEQWELPHSAKSATILNFANTAPIRYLNQVVTIHDASVFAAPAGYSLAFRLWYRALHRRLVRRARVVVTDSDFSQRELARYCGLAIERSKVIPLGAEHLLRELPDRTIVDRLSLKEKGFVLCAGSLNPNKNLAALVQTAYRLRGQNCPLVVAGGGNERVFRSSSVSFPENVRYTGYISDSQLRALYESAACFVFPSRYEGFGLPPLEAMASGCAVVSSNAASLPEVCGTPAIYCDPTHPPDFADAVLRVVGDQSLRSELSARGKTHAANFRWEKAARQWLGVVDTLFSG